MAQDGVVIVMAGSVSLDELMTRLGRNRPVFHSEADFQHAFAWEAHQLDPSLQVRLETHPEPTVRLDLLLARPESGAYTVVELKYLTGLWSGIVDGEHFALKNHGAQDVRAYDVVKDIARVERFVAGKRGWNGVFVALSNDRSYWRPVTHGRPTNADAFRIYEGSVLTGTRAWGPLTGAGTMKNRGDPIELLGTHRLAWRDYSRLDATSSGTFRSLIVEVTS
jgi:hypothetical protein